MAMTIWSAHPVTNLGACIWSVGMHSFGPDPVKQELEALLRKTARIAAELYVVEETMQVGVPLHLMPPAPIIPRTNDLISGQARRFSQNPFAAANC
eukprot:CAMPEP_0179144764 /NCGR_PEP_ID=MMETSP0796-20121207/69781_1 /TAXON_ID=73915 /ORGANISM="Pyrodinium bahamense, Strain pbaha01" /LENGTH=95 /DNA_ID=CAMNT_0020845051 /DNA_START=153 /DNA_END=440 /DNA_ORIENTATION=-